MQQGGKKKEEEEEEEEKNNNNQTYNIELLIPVGKIVLSHTNLWFSLA